MYIAIDGNSIGKFIEKLILSNRLAELSEFSNQMNSTIQYLCNAIESRNGNVYMAGGDNILAEIQESHIYEIINIVKEINNTNAYKFSVGISENLIDTYLALKYAKSSRENINIAIRRGDKIIFKTI